MSPLFAPIILVILLGIFLLFCGLIMREKKIIGCGALMASPLLVWLLLASLPPDPAVQFDRIFGVENRNAVVEIKTVKPTLMDGYFMSFRMSKIAFDQRIRPSCEPVNFRPADLLQGNKRPSGWPMSLEIATAGFAKKVETDTVFIFFDRTTDTVYVSQLYDVW